MLAVPHSLYLEGPHEIEVGEHRGRLWCSMWWLFYKYSLEGSVCDLRVPRESVSTRAGGNGASREAASQLKEGPGNNLRAGTLILTAPLLYIPAYVLS